MRTDLLLQVEADGTTDARELTKEIAEAVACLGGIRSVKLLASRPFDPTPRNARPPVNGRATQHAKEW